MVSISEIIWQTIPTNIKLLFIFFLVSKHTCFVLSYLKDLLSLEDKKNELAKELGRAPTHEEWANYVGCSIYQLYARYFCLITFLAFLYVLTRMTGNHGCFFDRLYYYDEQDKFSCEFDLLLELGRRGLQKERWLRQTFL
jgi:hypothetical protein